MEFETLVVKSEGPLGRLILNRPLGPVSYFC